MSCFENMTMPNCVWFESGEKRNIIASLVAGTLFFMGWWFIIDAASVYPHELPDASHVCGVLATLSLIMVNTVSNAQILLALPGYIDIIIALLSIPLDKRNSLLCEMQTWDIVVVRGETYTGGCMGPRGARFWLFLGFVIGFASLIASCWILFANNVNAAEKHTWSGVSLFMQNAFIFAGSLVFKFGRTEDLWN